MIVKLYAVTHRWFRQGEGWAFSSALPAHLHRRATAFAAARIAAGEEKAEAVIGGSRLWFRRLDDPDCPDPLAFRPGPPPVYVTILCHPAPKDNAILPPSWEELFEKASRPTKAGPQNNWNPEERTLEPSELRNPTTAIVMSVMALAALVFTLALFVSFASDPQDVPENDGTGSFREEVVKLPEEKETGGVPELHPEPVNNPEVIPESPPIPEDLPETAATSKIAPEPPPSATDMVVMHRPKDAEMVWDAMQRLPNRPDGGYDGTQPWRVYADYYAIAFERCKEEFSAYRDTREPKPELELISDFRRNHNFTVANEQWLFEKLLKLIGRTNTDISDPLKRYHYVLHQLYD